MQKIETKAFYKTSFDGKLFKFTYEGTKVATGKSFKKLKIVDAVSDTNRAAMRADQAMLLFPDSTQNKTMGDKI